MPVRDEAAYLSRSLGSVLAQDYPHRRMEVLVADGLSTDGTRSEVANAARSSDIPVTLVENTGRIVATGLNAALRQAHGEILVRVDGHCEIDPDYVRRCVGYLQKGEADGVGGPLETIGETPLARLIAVAMSSTFGVGGAMFRTGSERAAFVDTVAFPAYTRSTLETAGDFDEELVRNQDDEYNYRLRALGFRILLAPDVRSRYYSRGTLRSLARQYFQYGFWKVRVMQKHPRQMRPRQFAPLVLTAALLVSGLCAASGILTPLFPSILALYVAACFAASVNAAGRFRGDRRLLLLLPIVFATLHLSYGSGFLVGLGRFWNRWRGNARAPESVGPRQEADSYRAAAD